MKEVINILQKQVILKTNEVSDVKKELDQIKKAHATVVDKLHIDIADYKIKYAQCKQSIQDYESFIEDYQRRQATKMEEEVKDKNNEIIQLKVDLDTAKERMQSSISI